MSDGITYYGSLRRFFENEWFVPASKIGIGYWEFWDMNPRIIRLRGLAAEKELVRKDREFWLQGQYIYEAFAVVLSNAFSKKGSAKARYPEKPHLEGYEHGNTDPERNERIAMLEMDKYISALSKQGTVKKRGD